MMNSAKRNEPETNGKISARMERLAAAIASGQTDKAACQECKIGVTTLWRWRKTVPAFTARIEELRKECNERVLARLTAIMGGKALDVLECKLDARDDKGQPTATLADIKAAFELRGNITNDELMEMLEQILENQKGQR